MAFVSAGLIAPLDEPSSPAPPTDTDPPLFEPSDQAVSGPAEQFSPRDAVTPSQEVPSAQGGMPCRPPSASPQLAVGEGSRTGDLERNSPRRIVEGSIIIGPQTSDLKSHPEDSNGLSGDGLGERGTRDASLCDASDASEDIVVFKGRRWLAAQRSFKASLSSSPAITPGYQEDVNCPQQTQNVAFQADVVTGRGFPDTTMARETVGSPESPPVAHEDYGDASAPRSFTKQHGARRPLRHVEAQSFVPSNETDSAFHDIIDRWDQDPPESWMEADCDDMTMARLLSVQAGLREDDHDPVTARIRNTVAPPDDTEGERSPDLTDSLMSDSGPMAVAEPIAIMSALDNLALTEMENARYTCGARRRKQPPIFGLADAELEAALRSAWHNDRERKKGRKAAREDLRKQGLLGKSSSPDDLRTKYQGGIRLEEIQEELLSFLLGTADRLVPQKWYRIALCPNKFDYCSLPFPPMDKHARKLLHELAIKLSIKSQSTGKGDQRRPILYRTKATLRFSPTQRQEAMAKIVHASAPIRRRHFSRTDQIGSRHIKPRQSQTGGKAATYRDGEVVGASAPQIGEGNKGREMLEKMGWTTGTALGSSENKGILEPVAQVVKRSKAGLG